MKRIFYILLMLSLTITIMGCAKQEQPKPTDVNNEYSFKWLGENTELSWVVNGWVNFSDWDTTIQVVQFDFHNVSFYLDNDDTIVYKVRFLFDTIEKMEIYKNKQQYQFTTDFIKPNSYKFFTMQNGELIEIEPY